MLFAFIVFHHPSTKGKREIIPNSIKSPSRKAPADSNIHIEMPHDDKYHLKTTSIVRCVCKAHCSMLSNGNNDFISLAYSNNNPLYFETTNNIEHLPE